MSTTTIPLMVCTHCAWFIEAGCTEEEEPLLAMLIAQRWTGYKLHLVKVRSHYDRDAFSTEPCETCGSSLPGTRHDGAAWRIL